VKGQLWVEEDPFVRRIHRGMLAGQVREFSFAYTVADSREVEEDGQTIREIVRFDRIYEWGPVTAGMNPETELLEVAGLLAPSRLRAKRAAAVHSTPVVDERWDGARAVREAELPGDLAIFAWVDAEREDSKSAHKLPHHWPAAIDERRPAVVAGFRAAMGALLGARGGADIPSTDRRGVWEHLARHYRDADLEPPELRSFTPEELTSRGLELEAHAAAQVKHERGPSLIQEAHDLLVRAGAKCAPAEQEQAGQASGAARLMFGLQVPKSVLADAARLKTFLDQELGGSIRAPRDEGSTMQARWARLEALALEAARRKET
jgi:hypothetical protein